MTRNWLARILAAGVLTLAVASVGGAQSKESKNQPLTDEHVQELVRAAALRAGVQGPLTSLQPAAGAQGAVSSTLPLALDDAIKLALERNLDIAVQRLNPQTFDYSIAAIRATYQTSLVSTLAAQSTTSASSQTLNGTAVGTATDNSFTNWNGGATKLFSWGGGNVAATLNNSRQTSTSPNFLYQTLYSPTWSATYNQPLLRNFKIDNTRQQLAITKINQDMSEIQLQALIINTVSNVRNAYWDYVFATQSVEVARRSVELADQLVRDNQTRVEIGTMAPIDVVQAQSQAATQRQNLATAEGTRQTNELILKRLIVGGTQDPNWSASINPTDRPEFVPVPVDVPAAVRRALENRTDLQQAKKSLQINDVTLKYLHNQTMPQVDFNARYGVNGQGGTAYITEGSGIARTIVGTVPGGYGDALSSLFRQSLPLWNVGLTVTYPLGTSTQEANLARARVQQSQVEAQMKQIELTIATDVTNAAVSLVNNGERVQAAQAAREFAQKQLEAEQSKFEVGMSTNYFVVQAQRDLATAQNNELQAILAYRRSQVELERLQQTSLQTANITILGR